MRVAGKGVGLNSLNSLETSPLILMQLLITFFSVPVLGAVFALRIRTDKLDATESCV